MILCNEVEADLISSRSIDERRIICKSSIRAYNDIDYLSSGSRIASPWGILSRRGGHSPRLEGCERMIPMRWRVDSKDHPLSAMPCLTAVEPERIRGINT